MTITDDQRRREAQQRLLAEILGQARAEADADAEARARIQAQIERQRLLSAARQQQTQAQPITDPGQRRAAQQRAITQLLTPRPQGQPQAQQNAGMNQQTREFFESQRLLNAPSLRQRESQRLLNAQVRRGQAPQFDPSADDRIARKLNAIAKRSDIEVTQNNGAIEIRTRGSMRDSVIRAITSPRIVSSSSPRYR
jgi:hypothetical protein